MSFILPLYKENNTTKIMLKQTGHQNKESAKTKRAPKRSLDSVKFNGNIEARLSETIVRLHAQQPNTAGGFTFEGDWQAFDVFLLFHWGIFSKDISETRIKAQV